MNQTEAPTTKQTIRHYGFAQVPRILIRGTGSFQDNRLSLVELGLYTGLKDICGEEGECFYTLRNLAKVLNTSASTLSRHIPVLHKKKVIEAKQGKQEVWHIRIVNVWAENDALYSSQDCFKMKQSEDETVSNCNKPDENTDFVSECNTFVSECNKDPQVCFNLTYKEELDNKDTQSKESNTIVANATTPAHTVSSSKSSSGETPLPTKKAHPKKEKPTVVASPARKPEILLSEKARAVYDAWCKAPWFRGVPPKLTQRLADHCTTLAACDPLPTTEDMVKTRHWYAKRYPERSGFQLGNFVDAYPQYLSDQYKPTPEQSRPATEDNPLPIDEQVRAYLQANQEKMNYFKVNPALTLTSERRR